MGIRSRLASVFTGPAVVILESTIRDAVAEALNDRRLARHSDVDTLTQQLDGVRRSLQQAHQSVEGIQQALDAFSREEEEDVGDIIATQDLGDRLDTVAARNAEITRRLEITQRSTTVLEGQLTELQALNERAQSQLEQATQLGTSARATAEATADGVVGLEARLDALQESMDHS